MASELPKTTAELTGYKSTSRYDEVMAFIAAIQKIDPSIRVETFATTREGRALPLVIAGPAGVVDPRTAHASGLPVVFIMANIHAGEVEGKEAALMLLRDLISSRKKLRRELVLLVAPIYNADGNERISTSHRTTQNGPVNGVGVRENGQGLDLNRDFMKLESPEARGLVRRVLGRWDPLLTVDLHTTNGSYHGYQLTYSPSLNPNTDGDLLALERTMLASIRTRMREKHGKETFDYGNFVDQLQPEKGWYTFDSRPRFGNNYVGLRNRFTILSEAYSYIPFRDRVEVTYAFVGEILRAVTANGRKMQRVAARADARSRALKSQGVRFEIRPSKKNAEILWERAEPAPEGGGIPNPDTGSGANIVRRGEIDPVKTTHYGVFAAIETSDVPFAYLIDARAANAVETLRTHGVVVERLEEAVTLKVQQFVIAEAKHAERAFQNHHELALEGKWKSAEATFAAGTFVVRTDQPLARLAFYLLDPRSDDGLFAWNVFDDLLGETAPVARLMKERPLHCTILPEAGP
jgi:hypothetical protein